MEEALTAVYKVCTALDLDETERAKFIKTGPQPGAVSPNRHQPIVRTLFKEVKSDLRSRITTWAGAIAWAAGKKIKPGQFRAHVEKLGGIEAAYTLWRRQIECPQAVADKLEDRENIVADVSLQRFG